MRPIGQGIRAFAGMPLAAYRRVRRRDAWDGDAVGVLEAARAAASVMRIYRVWVHVYWNHDASTKGFRDIDHAIQEISYADTEITTVEVHLKDERSSHTDANLIIAGSATGVTTATTGADRNELEDALSVARQHLKRRARAKGRSSGTRSSRAHRFLERNRMWVTLFGIGLSVAVSITIAVIVN